MTKKIRIFIISVAVWLILHPDLSTATLRHFPEPHRSSSNMSILLLEISGVEVTEFSEIAVITPDSVVAGATVLDETPPWGLAAWADDETTDQIDGLRVGDTLRFIFWDPVSQREISAGIPEIVNGSSLHFSADGLLVLKIPFVPEIEWIEMPVEVTGETGTTITFNVSGKTSNDDDVLTITFSSVDLPQAAGFVDHHDGTGTFIWQTIAADTGAYSATFTLSNGVIEISAVVAIYVIPPQQLKWIEMPEEIEGDGGNLIEFDIEGESTDINDNLTIHYRSDDLPQSAGFVDYGDGSGTFSWQTSIADSGNYHAIFTLSNGSTELEDTVLIRISPFRPSERINVSLKSPEPNPFSGLASIRYSIPFDLSHSLKAFDLTGRYVMLLGKGASQGEYCALIDINDLSSGMYIFMLEVGRIRKFTKGVALKGK